MASLYGVGNINTQIFEVPADITPEDVISNEVTPYQARSFIDPKEVEAYLRKEFADTPILVDIARCESTFRQFHRDGTVVRGRVDNADTGVMQINLRYHGETAQKMGLNLNTIEGNTAYGKYLYNKSGSAPWSASEKCWSGAYGQIAQK